jgi:general secretion pathway protein D
LLTASLFYRSWAMLTVGLVSSLLFVGCTLPSQQLTLPGPITGSVANPAIENNNRRQGVPLAKAPADETQWPRVYEGSGEFAATAAATGPLQGQSGPRASIQENGDITVNLVGATVQELAQTVLGEVMKQNFTVSDKVQAKVTLSTPQPVTKDQLLSIFEAVLKAEGIAMVYNNGTYLIGQNEAITQNGAPASWSRNQRSAKAGTGTQVLSLRYISATEMERIIRSFAPNTNVARVDESRNHLILTGTQAELESIFETASVFDVDWMKGMSVGIFPIESGDPEAIAQEMDTIFANDRDSPVKGIVRFVPNKRLKSVLVISARPEYLRKAEQWLQRIDLAGQATAKQIHVYHVQNRSAAEVAELLQKVYTSQIRPRQTETASTEPGSDTDVFATTPDDLAQGNRGGVFNPQPGVPLFPSVQQPLIATPTGERSSTTALDGNQAASGQTAAPEQVQFEPGDDRGNNISIVSDVANNSLVITATPSEYQRMRQILSRIDIAPNQVLIEATIAEVTLNDNLQYGLKWFFQNKSNQFTFTDSVVGAVAPTFPGFSYFLNNANIRVALDALSEVTDVNVVSSPSLTVIDNKKAVLQIGDEVPIATQSAVSVTAPGAPIVNTISFRNTGVILGITPRIGDNGRVLLDIEQEVSDVVPTTSSTLDSPTIQQRRIKTTVAVNDGESVVLAGLIQDRATVTRGQVPLLGDVPIVGNLFKNKTDEIRRTELLIALTPHVVKDQDQLRSISAEFRDRMNFTTRPQRAGPPDRRENIERLIVR